MGKRSESNIKEEKEERESCVEKITPFDSRRDRTGRLFKWELVVGNYERTVHLRNGVYFATVTKK